MPSTISTYPNVRSCPNLLAITAISSVDVSGRVSLFFEVVYTVAYIERRARGRGAVSNRP